METRSHRRTNRRKFLKRLLYSVLAIVIIVGGGVAFAYYKLSPANHFKASKVISPGSSNVKPKTGTVNFLLLGSDQRKGDKLGHTDSILLIHVDFNTNKISAVSIPRDTRINVPGYGYTKLTSVQYIEQADKGPKDGIVAAVQTISQMTGVPINYYAETNYGGLKSMVDVLGKVEISVPFDVTFTHPWYKEDKDMVIKKGTQQLDGKMVTELVHERDSVPGTDFGRQKLQERALVGIAKTAMKPQHIADLPSLIKQSSNFLTDTNMSQTDMLSFGLAVKKLDLAHIKYYQIKGTSQTMYDDILQRDNDQVVLDQTSLEETMSHFK
ncbi:LCP family protein [Pullulanibacillus sp. KACC 23026]|uniref:LCP family protein n=1 Tax=Pullulanibacillus sp. KACC 23026 TaxID=3028315 RepID=UPI0023AFCC84|nr:LCP family protein [Pullulanibacillus sp. KACC 23026]WEG13292.1 LCP family protein [Pullulanibacillus sp. KACC 23026]